MDVRRVTDDFSVSPQIAPGDLATLRDQAFALVINNRPDGEEPGQPSGAQIEAAAHEAGLNYRAIPVAGGFAEPQVAEMAEAITNASGPVFALCRSGTRSTLLWALAQGREWIPPHEDGELAAELERVGTSASPAVLGLAARAGERAEVDLHLRLRPGLTAEQVSAVVQLVTQGLGGSQLVAERISSMRSGVASPCGLRNVLTPIKGYEPSCFLCS